METICKKCIEQGGKRWNPIGIEEYKKIFVKLPWFKDITDENNNNNNNTLINIAGQLQLIEFFNKINIDCEIPYDDNAWYDECTGDSGQEEGELKPILDKQVVCAVGSIIEAICYTILRYKNIDFQKIKDTKIDNTNLTSMLKLIKNNNLLPEDEIKLCLKIKDLRNRVHLFDQIETDANVFHWSREISESAMNCLYFLLRRWLDASDNIMQIYFPFVPVPLIYEKASGDITKFFEELEKRESIPQKKPKIYFIQLGPELKLEGKAICKIIWSAGISMAVPLPYLENSSKKSLDSQIAIAQKFAFPYVLIFGQEEALSNSVIIRNMSDKSQKTMELADELLEYLKNISDS
jgi:hypothetical protein